MRTISRILKAGTLQFWRNGFITFSAIVMFVVVLSMVAGVLFFRVVSTAYQEYVASRADVTVYFTPDAKEVEILAFKKQLELLKEVSEVLYTTKEEAFEQFKTQWGDDEVTAAGLRLLGDNPLGAQLEIKAQDLTYFSTINKFIEGKRVESTSLASIIEDVNYVRNKEIINNLERLTRLIEQLGWIVSFLFAIVVLITTFNTVRLSVYASREEISVMKLMGATNFFVRGPYIFNGMLCGLVGALITSGGLYVAVILFDRTISTFTGLDVVRLFAVSFGQMFVMLILVGIVVGAVTNYIAVRRYLHI